MSEFKTIDSERVSGKRVLIRVDLNVPMKNGQVTDAKTLTGALWLQNVLSGAWVLDWQAATS